MGNSFLVLFRFAAPRPRRRKVATFLGLAVEQAEVDVGEACDPVAGFGLGDADGLADERLAGQRLLDALGIGPAKGGVAIDGKSLRPGRATATQNKPGKLLPMFPVQSVTYDPGRTTLH